MNANRFSRGAVTALLGACLLGAPRGASATPLVDTDVGGLLFVGPTSAHVTAIYWNPAAAGLLEGTHFYLSAGAQFDRTTVNRQPISSANGEPSASGDKSFPGVTDTPFTKGAFFGLTSDLKSDRITVGAAVYTPFAEELPDGGDATAYHGRGGEFYGTYGTLSLSLRATDKLVFGAGISAVFQRVQLRFDRDVNLESCAAPPCDAENHAPGKSQKLAIDSGNDFLGFDVRTPAGVVIAFNLGVMAKISGWWVGAAFLSSPSPLGAGAIPLDGTATVDGKVGAARITYWLPPEVHLGLRHPIADGWDLALAARWIGLGAHDTWDLRLNGAEFAKDGTVPEWQVRARDFQDVYSADAGIEGTAGRDLRLGARVRLESSAVPQEMLAIDQVDGPKVQLAVGAEVRLIPGLALSAGYAFTYVSAGTASPSAFSPSGRIDCTASHFDFDRCAATREGLGLPTAAGDYGKLTHQLVVGLSWDWW